MGDGKLIRLFADPWLPRLNTFRPNTIQNSDSLNTQVSDLIVAETQTLNDEEIKRLLWVVDHEVVTSIPLSMNSVPDKLLWHFDGK